MHRDAIGLLKSAWLLKSNGFSVIALRLIAAEIDWITYENTRIKKKEFTIPFTFYILCECRQWWNYEHSKFMSPEGGATLCMISTTVTRRWYCSYSDYEMTTNDHNWPRMTTNYYKRQQSSMRSDHEQCCFTRKHFE